MTDATPVKRGRGRPRKVRPEETQVVKTPEVVQTDDSNVIDIDAIIADAEKRSADPRPVSNVERMAAHTAKTNQAVSEAEEAARRWHRGR